MARAKGHRNIVHRIFDVLAQSHVLQKNYQYKNSEQREKIRGIEHEFIDISIFGRATSNVSNKNSTSIQWLRDLIVRRFNTNKSIRIKFEQKISWQATNRKAPEKHTNAQGYLIRNIFLTFVSRTRCARLTYAKINIRNDQSEHEQVSLDFTNARNNVRGLQFFSVLFFISSILAVIFFPLSLVYFHCTKSHYAGDLHAKSVYEYMPLTFAHALRRKYP